MMAPENPAVPAVVIKFLNMFICGLFISDVWHQLKWVSNCTRASETLIWTVPWCHYFTVSLPKNPFPRTLLSVHRLRSHQEQYLLYSIIIWDWVLIVDDCSTTPWYLWRVVEDCRGCVLGKNVSLKWYLAQ